MYIIGFDPGLVTGVSIVLIEADTIELVESHQLADLDFFAFLEGIRACNYGAVGWESFILRRGGPYTSDQTLPCYVIGALEYWNYTSSGKTPFEVTPSQNKSGVTDDDLQKLGLYGPEGHANRHQRDATRVIVNHLITQRNMTVLRALR